MRVSKQVGSPTSPTTPRYLPSSVPSLRMVTGRQCGDSKQRPISQPGHCVSERAAKIPTRTSSLIFIITCMRPALHVAAAAHQQELAESLVARGADVRARNRRGAEPLHYAADRSPSAGYQSRGAQRKVIVYLIEAGARPDVMDKSGVAPLHRAVRSRCSDAVSTLGVDTTTPNGEFVANVLSSFAQFERQMISVRTREALAAARQRGVQLGRRSAISDEVLFLILTLHDDGWTATAIARHLSNLRLPTSQGGSRWHTSTITRILTRQGRHFVRGRPARSRGDHTSARAE